MSVQAALRNELLLAERAVIRPLSSVESSVCGQIVFDLESPRTVFALKRPLSRMDANVVHHAVLLLEPSLAIWTLELADIGVDLEVLLQVALSVKMFMANVAFKGNGSGRTASNLGRQL